MVFTAETAFTVPRYLTMAQEISLAISVGCFGFVVGFMAGYAMRAYLSYLHRRPHLYRRGTLRGWVDMIVTGTERR